MDPRVSLFVGFKVEPTDFLKEEEEVRRVDCGHDPDPDAKFCDECGTRLDNVSTKVKLKDSYRNTFDPPNTQYTSIHSEEVVDWLEYKAIRSNYDDVNTDRPVGPEAAEPVVVVGERIEDARLNDDQSVSTTDRKEIEEHIDEIQEIHDDLRLDREIGIHLVEKLHV